MLEAPGFIAVDEIPKSQIFLFKADFTPHSLSEMQCFVSCEGGAVNIILDIYSEKM